MTGASAECLQAIESTRIKAATIVAHAFAQVEGKSEKEICEEIVHEQSTDSELLPLGWYDPPPAGVSVLIGKDRMGYDSIRKPEYWPRTDVRYTKDVPAMIYLSPVDRTTQMIGDFGLTIYQGSDSVLQQHFKRGLAAILEIAEHSQVGVSFADLHATGLAVISSHGFVQARMSLISQSLGGDENLGHTVPWSDGEPAPGELPIEQLREKIRVARYFINSSEQYRIPETCAFTVESRLIDPKKPDLPNIFFHVIVTFSRGEKKILSNFTDIFKSSKMAYML